MKRDKPSYLREHEIKRWGESLRYFAKHYAQDAERLEREAAIARDKARWFLEAAEAKAAAKQARKGERRAANRAQRDDAVAVRIGRYAGDAVWMRDHVAGRDRGVIFGKRRERAAFAGDDVEAMPGLWRLDERPRRSQRRTAL
jgi:hypothetical protein